MFRKPSPAEGDKEHCLPLTNKSVEDRQRQWDCLIILVLVRTKATYKTISLHFYMIILTPRFPSALTTLLTRRHQDYGKLISSTR